jgi:hypothetical protein
VVCRPDLVSTDPETRERGLRRFLDNDGKYLGLSRDYLNRALAPLDPLDLSEIADVRLLPPQGPETGPDRGTGDTPLQDSDSMERAPPTGDTPPQECIRV